MEKLLISAVIFTLAFVFAILGIESRYGGGDRFPDMTKSPTLPGDSLEVVAELDLPPGNIAVSKQGRIFFSYHPEAKPKIKMAEVINGKAQPLILDLPEGISLQTVLGIRIDNLNRLWLLDNADHGTGQPRLLAFDIDTKQLVHQYNFTSKIAGIGSHLNDLAISNDGQYIFIADASIFGKTPAIIVYDVKTQTVRRLLEDHEGVKPDFYTPVVQGHEMLLFGILAVRPGVDSIALDRTNEWLYFAPVTDEFLYRIRFNDLLNKSLSSEELANKVEWYAAKSMSDGISLDNENRIYITDIENSSINRLWPDGSLETYVKDKKLRWPDGLSFGQDGWLYVTSSSLQHVIFKSESEIRSKGPYHIFRLKTDGTATAGQ